jgi:hypothetical protein
MSYESFQTRDPSQQTIPLDANRAKLLVYNFEPASLDTRVALREFVGSLHAASSGNPDVLPLLVDAFKQWHVELDDGKQERAKLESLWKAFDAGQRTPHPDPVKTLKMFCMSQPIPLPDSMVHAIFDDPSFDFAAYLDCLPPKEDAE